MIERHYGTLIEGAGADIARRLNAFEADLASRARADMTDDLYDDSRAIALERAISAAENATQTVACIWELLSPTEQDRWLAHARAVTPRRDVALKTLLPAADKLLAELRAVDS